MMGFWEMNLWQIITLGGPLMVPIIFCSIFAVTIISVKLIYFSRIRTDTHRLKADIFELLKQDRIQEAVDLCSANPSPVAKIMKAGILAAGRSHEEIKEAMENASRFEIPKLESRFAALSTIAHVSPLLGLLGTVTGMTTTFQTIQQLSLGTNPITPGDFAGGIWEALLTTVAGLVVAIPTLIAYNYLVSRVDATVDEMEFAAAELTSFLNHLNESRVSQVADATE